ncbi:MAG TPA: nucleoside/nucleotide kinase family protein [Propionibacteriaceae bacterium]|nr:nucleoside/nucleotide kinase family protein [Propionibacteriaceae bacterium]
MTAGPEDPAVVVAGDALVDMTPTTTIRGHLAYEPHPGGSCLNVAVGLARLDVPTAFLARLSRDAFGDLLRAHLAASGVQPSYLIETDDLTTLAAVDLRDGQATYAFHAQGAADRGLLPEHLTTPLPHGAALHLGSIALVLEPVASTLDGLLRRESGRRVVSLDPNVRPGLIPDRERYLRRFEGWLPHVDILKLSEEDLAWLYPDRPQQEVVANWHAAGVALVVVTHGQKGAAASTSLASASAAAPTVWVVDTVGAGDAFMSGALAHLYERGLLNREALRSLGVQGLTEMLQTACLVAADTCTRAGAEPPRRHDLEVHSLGGPREVTLALADLVERARAMAVPGQRHLLGITGAPGAGKSKVALEIVDKLGADLAVLIPMDGFHLSNQTLITWGRRGRKGAWDTFDADGYVHLLRRLRNQEEEIVHAPDFDRDIDESIGCALPVRREVPLVVTEGNYLLSDLGGWVGVASLLDECWYLEADDATRLQRLTYRHQQHGMSHQQAATWARTTDQDNADQIVRSRARADLVIMVAGS